MEFIEGKAVVPQYGIQLVVNSEIDGASNFRGTGNLDLTKQKVRDYGSAVGERMKRLGVVACRVFPNKKFDGPCFTSRYSKVRDFHLDTLVQTLSNASGIKDIAVET